MRAVAFAVMAAERLLITALPVLAVLSVFLIVSWLGLWRLSPDWLKIVASIGFFGAFAATLLRFRHFRLPERAEVDRRLETRSELEHQALSIQTEEPVNADAYSLALWKAHQAKMAEKIRVIESGGPSPDIARRDPYALRAVLVLGLVVAWTFSQSNFGGRISDVFTYADPDQGGSGIRIDAWVTPPTYTGVAPVYLTGVKARSPEGVITVPHLSELTIRISGDDVSGSEVTFTPDGGKTVLIAPEKPEGEKDEAKKQPETENAVVTSKSYLFKLPASGKVTVDSTSYTFNVTPDNAPQIAFDKEPNRALNGALEIAFTGKDDYGITEAFAEILPAEDDPEAIPLFDPPVFPLDLPGANAKEVKATSSRDLTEHPLSGKKVKLTLVAKDAAGNEGRSATRIIVLPQRFFAEPLAGSIVEQRQVFSLDIRKVARALELNEVAGFRADETIPNLTDYLLLQSAGKRLKLARSVTDLEETSAYFWDIARYIEDGDLSSAEKRLRNAQEKLAEALKRNASDKEIEQLMKELREAMREYMNELAKRMQQDPNAMQQMTQQAQRMLRAQDLDNMLNQLENLARSGSREEAQRLLSEMQRMLNNLQTARPRPGQQQNPMREQIDKLGELMQKQQKLMEDTYRTERSLQDRLQRGESFEDDMPLMEQDPQMGQQSPRQQSPEDQMTAEELRKALREMKKRQSELQKELDSLNKKLSEMGLKPMPGFGDAQKEMGESADALGKSEGQRSAEAQGRALEALRQGAGQLMQQLAEMGRNNGQQGMPMPGGEMTEGRDPLGRRSGQLGAEIDDQVKVPDQIDVQRAREILDMIRRKLGEGPSSIIEKEYLERLLDLR